MQKNALQSLSMNNNCNEMFATMLLKIKASYIVKQLNLICRSPGAEALPNCHTGPSKKPITMQNT